MRARPACSWSATWTSARRLPSGCRTRRGAFVDTLMVTNATAVRGIGNRPGRWDFLSGPLFPYGKRIMSLPIWAHARGKTYNTRHDAGGRPAPWAARPRAASAGTSRTRRRSSTSAARCSRARRRRPSAPRSTRSPAPRKFNSEKGKFDPTTPTYYPPRSDLTTFTSLDGQRSADVRGDQRSRRGGGGDPGLRLRSTTGPGRSPVHAAARRLHPDGRGEQGVRLERLEHAPRLRRQPPAGLWHRGQLRTAVGRLSGPDSHRRHDRTTGRRGRPRRSPATATGRARRASSTRRDATISTSSPGSGEGRLLA